MIDAGAFFRSLILAEPTVAAFVESRVYVDRLPKGVGQCAAIILQADPEDGGGEIPIQTVSFDVICIGKYMDDAVAVDAALRDALHDEQDARVDGVKVIHVEQDSPGHVVYDDTTEWPTVLSRWRLIIPAA